MEDLLQQYGKAVYEFNDKLLRSIEDRDLKQIEEILKAWESRIQETAQYLNIEIDPKLKQAFERLYVADQTKDEYLQFIVEAIDRSNTFSQELVKVDLTNHIEQSIEKASPEVKSEVQQAANSMFTEMKNLEEAEKNHGMAPETWREFSGEHVPAVKESLKILRDSVKQSLKNIFEEKCKAVSEAFHKGTQFLKEGQEKLVNRNLEIKSDLKEIKDLLLSIDQQLKNMDLSVPEQQQPLMAVQRAQTDLAEKLNIVPPNKERSPFLILKKYKDVKQKFLDIKKSIVEFPEKVNRAARNKVAELIAEQTEKIVSKVTGIIQSLEEKREKIIRTSENLQKNVADKIKLSDFEKEKMALIQLEAEKEGSSAEQYFCRSYRDSFRNKLSNIEEIEKWKSLGGFNVTKRNIMNKMALTGQYTDKEICAAVMKFSPVVVNEKDFFKVEQELLAELKQIKNSPLFEKVELTEAEKTKIALIQLEAEKVGTSPEQFFCKAYRDQFSEGLSDRTELEIEKARGILNARQQYTMMEMSFTGKYTDKEICAAVMNFSPTLTNEKEPAKIEQELMDELKAIKNSPSFEQDKASYMKNKGQEQSKDNVTEPEIKITRAELEKEISQETGVDIVPSQARMQDEEIKATKNIESQIEENKGQEPLKVPEEQKDEINITRADLAKEISKESGLHFVDVLKNIDFVMDEKHGIHGNDIPEEMVEEIKSQFETLKKYNETTTEVEQSNVEKDLKPLVEMEEVKNAKDINQIRAGLGSDEKEIYFSYLKNVLEENPDLNNTQADEKVIATLGQEHMDYKKIAECLSYSPAYQDLSADDKKMEISLKVFNVVNPVLTQNEEIANAKPLIELRRWSPTNEIYNSHLKNVLSENPCLHIDEANHKIVETLMNAKMDAGKVKECLLSTPKLSNKNLFEKQQYVNEFMEKYQKQQGQQQEISR